MTMWRSKLGNTFPRAEVEKLDAEHHRILKKLRSQPGNDKCVECGKKENTWCSVNLGVFLCVQCADVHRALGTHISKVKGCGGTYLWGPDEIAQMQSLGNSAWGSHGAQINSSMGKEEQLRVCRQKYENKPLPQNTKGHAAATKAANASSVPEVSSRSAAQDGYVNAVQCASKHPSQKSCSDELDSFLEDCLNPSDVVSKHQAPCNLLPNTKLPPTSLLPAISSTPVQMPSSLNPIDLDWCVAPAVPAPPSQAPSCIQPTDLGLHHSTLSCFAPAPPSKGSVCVPAPPSQGVTARSLSGFDFDKFFDECLQSSTSCDAGNLQASASCDAGKVDKLKSFDVGKAQNQKNSVSQQFDPLQICQQVQVSIPNQSAQPQPALTGMMFDSDAFFNDMLGSASGRNSTLPLKSSSVMW